VTIVVVVVVVTDVCRLVDLVLVHSFVVMSFETCPSG